MIVSAAGHHLWLRDLDTLKRVGPCHPLWEMDYGDGIDHGAIYDARVEAFNAALNRGRSRKAEALQSPVEAHTAASWEEQR